MFSRQSWSEELGACLHLAAPIALAQVAQVTMTLTDTAIITKLGANAIGAVGLGHNAFYGAVWPIVGVLYCLDTYASQAVGRADPKGAARAFAQAMWLWFFICIACLTLTLLVSNQMPSFGVNAEIAPVAGAYLRAMMWGIPAAAFTFASTKFLQAHGKTKPIVIIALGANVANAVLVYGLVYGRFGLPALGIEGAGYGTAACRWLIALSHLYALTTGRFPFERKMFRPDLLMLRQMLRLGIPAGLQMAFEIGMFALSGFLIARFEPSMLAAHHILLQLATFTFMLPVGISAAAAVRVGHAIGAADQLAAAHRGNVAIAFGAAVMTLSGLLMVLLGSSFTRLFDAPADVTAAFAALVVWAAAFQIFDGIQVTATGALRGLGNTRAAFVANMVGYWVFAFPAALLLGFKLDLQARGIWMALCLGLIVVASSLLWVWRSHTARLTAWIARSSSAEIISSPSSTTTS